MVVKVALLRFAVLVGDLTHQGQAQAHDAAAFDLCTNALWVDLRAAVDGDVDSGDGLRRRQPLPPR
jgi:hypothetical protein